MDRELRGCDKNGNVFVEVDFRSYVNEWNPQTTQYRSVSSAENQEDISHLNLVHFGMLA